MIYRLLLRLIIALTASSSILGQTSKMLPPLKNGESLLDNITIQLEVTSGIDDMYNFNFNRAESQFQWIKLYYPNHPLPYFLMALSQWWKILPNFHNESYDNKLLVYLDSTIIFSKNLLKKSNKNTEAIFFLTASYAFKSRLMGERENWARSLAAASKTFKYLYSIDQKINSLSIEFLLGYGLYNYYIPWIKKEYRFLKTLLWIYPDGNAEDGLKKIEKSSRESFYTRIEAQFFLINIYSSINNIDKALFIIEQLYGKYPNNPYFERQYAYLLYRNGEMNKMREICESILKKVALKNKGYDNNTARYSCFFLGKYYNAIKNYERAKFYFLETIFYLKKINLTKSTFYISSLRQLAKYEIEKDNLKEACYYYSKIKENTDKNSYFNKEAKKYLKKNKNSCKK